MKVRHDMLARLLLHTCAAQQSHKYGSTGSHATERKRHATYYRRTKACRSRDELQSQESVRQTAKTAAYWAPGIDTMAAETSASIGRTRERTNDGRDYSAEGLHRSSDCDGQKRLASRAQPQGFKACIVQCALQRSAVQLQGSLAVNMFGAPRAARAVD
jgi:hypothetical protein